METVTLDKQSFWSGPGNGSFSPKEVAPKKKQLRIVLYSHDTLGLGHIRRNLLIAQSLASSLDNPSILMVTGAQEAGNYAIPEGADCLILPALYKTSKGNYEARRLGTSIEKLKALRSRTICASVAAFDPHLFIVDNVPRGACQELDATLEYLRIQGRTQCILGLRDIKDEPRVAKMEWEKDKSEEIIARYYDEVWVYGDGKIYDPVREYDYSPEVARKVRYTGYLDQRARLDFSKTDASEQAPGETVPSEPFVLCMVGGGQDGAFLAESFLKSQLPKGINGVLIAGPHMNSKKRSSLLKKCKPNFKVFEFVSEPTKFLQVAECVISMGGYNSVSEVISFEKRTLVIPRVIPRKEQFIRADRLQNLGILDMLLPGKLSSKTLSKWIALNVRKPSRKFRNLLDLKGLTRIPQLVTNLINSKVTAMLESTICQ